MKNIWDLKHKEKQPGFKEHNDVNGGSSMKAEALEPGSGFRYSNCIVVNIVNRETK